MASTIKYTRGPWALCDRGDYADLDGNSRVILGDDKRIAVVHDHGTEEDRANALLLTAAPEMFQALKALLSSIEYVRAIRGPGGDDLRRRAHAALAKAGGE